MAKNQAAWIKSAKANPLVVEEAPMWQPKAGELLIKNVTAGVNSVDYKIQDRGLLIQTYPFILGWEFAGTVEAVGEGVTGFAKGDRVITIAACAEYKSEYGAYQHYSLAFAFLTTKLPAGISFDEGAVLPIGFATAASGLFPTAYLHLSRPSAAGPDPALKGKKVLIWGGSSTVGASAVQLASRAVYTVVSTASPHNHAFVVALGAAQVFDHRDQDVVAKIRAAFGGDWLGAYDAISEPGTITKCAEVIQRGLVAVVVHPPKDLSVPEGITVKWLNGGLLATTEKEIGTWLFNEYLPAALANGSVKIAPQPHVLRGGLSVVQEGIDLLHKGVSAKKIVVRLVD